MDKQKKCDITKDLLPLYADEICSQSTRGFVEEHLAECVDCREELEAYRYNTGIPGEQEKDVFIDFSKGIKKRNFVKVVLSVIICLAVIASAAYVLFVPEYVVPYTDGIMEAEIPYDGGIDVYVKLDNYKEVCAWDLKDDKGNTDIYLTVIQTNYTKLFDDSDKSDNMWRVGNSNTTGVCFQSGNVLHLSGEKNKISNIYYLEMNPEDILYMTDGISFEDYETHLIWSASEG